MQLELQSWNYKVGITKLEVRSWKYEVGSTKIEIELELELGKHTSNFVPRISYFVF